MISGVLACPLAPSDCIFLRSSERSIVPVPGFTPEAKRDLQLCKCIRRPAVRARVSQRPPPTAPNSRIRNECGSGYAAAAANADVRVGRSLNEYRDVPKIQGPPVDACPRAGNAVNATRKPTEHQKRPFSPATQKQKPSG